MFTDILLLGFNDFSRPNWLTKRSGDITSYQIVKSIREKGNVWNFQFIFCQNKYYLHIKITINELKDSLCLGDIIYAVNCGGER